MDEKEEKSFLDYMMEEGRDKKENPILRKLSIIFWYRSIARIPDWYREVKWFFQRLFRSYHASDCDIWGLHDHLAPIILGKLKAFRASPLHGYPSIFSEWGYEGCTDEYGGMGMTKEEYDKAREAGDFVGGEFDAWLKTLDEMIFAFDFMTNYEASDKKRDAMLARYGLEYPHKKIPENKRVNYVYRIGKKGEKDSHIMTSHVPPDDPENKNREYLGEDIGYYNFELERKYYERVQKGLSLFAKHFMSLWD
jgi:hypothetical protein